MTYIQRVDLIKDVVLSHTKLDNNTAHELSEEILQALNSIPEKMR